MHDAPQCLACGACCFSTLDTYVRVSGDDHARLGDAGQLLCHFIEHRCYMRLEDGHCAALRCDVAASFFCAASDDGNDSDKTKRRTTKNAIRFIVL